MPRKPRIEFEGAVYHVMCRGDHGEDVYRDEHDRHGFLECLAQVCMKTCWRVHAYVLLSNHYHLLVETPRANLVVGMHWLQGTYTGRYNRRHRLRGHLFQGRYKPLLIEPEQDDYFLQVATYIHLNPVRAGLAGPRKVALKEYPWSSYPAYLATERRRPAWLCVERVLAALALADTAAERSAYAAHMAERVRQALRRGDGDLARQWEAIRRGWCLGGEDFRTRMQRRLDKLLHGHLPDSYAGPAVEEHQQRTAEELLAAGLKAVGLSPDDLPDLPKTDPRKQAVAWWIRKHTTARNRWVSERLHMGHEVNVCQAVRRIEHATRGKLAGWKKAVVKTLKSKD